MEDVFALCYGFPDGGSMLLGGFTAAEELSAAMQLQGLCHDVHCTY
jgi:hypothetical protein